MIEMQLPTAPVAVIGGHDSNGVYEIVRGLQERIGLAIVVACTGHPDLAVALRGQTALSVIEVRGRTKLQVDQIYVVPEDATALYDDGDLVLDGGGQAAPLDRLVRSVADGLGASCAAVILAGPRSDGALGLRRIKEAGGLAIVQTPEAGLQGEMMRSAVATGVVDLVLEPGEIPGRLFTLAQTLAEPPHREPSGPDVAETLRDILTLLRVRTGHDFGAYKRSTLFRRISRRMQVCGTSTIADYHEHLRDHPGELHHLLRDFLISVTNFFRDPEAFAALATQVIPKLFEHKSSADQVRVWASGCATGEEAYSIGMLLLEHAARLNDPPSIQIFATDIDENALAEARAGRYPEGISVDVSAERLERFFVHESDAYRVSNALRELVLFSPHNVLRDPPFSRLDLISCRNLLIYLNRDAQDRVLNVFHFGLRTDGFLFLGSSESSENTTMFEPIDVKMRLFVRRFATSSVPVDVVVGRWKPSLPQPPAPNPSIDRLVTYGEVHHRLVEQYAPPSVIVNEQLDVLHVSEHAGKFLQLPGGEPSRELLRLVHPAIRLELRTAIFAAKQSKASDSRTIRFEEDGRSRSIDLQVKQIDLPDIGSGTLLVLFDERDGREPDGDGTDHQPSRQAYTEVEPVVREIEDELRRTREQLRNTIEQYETSLEELKASNEELQAINEELRSASEELETSKEELQSVNEELTTLNHELKVKVDEVSRANSDLQNLMTSTDIGVVFLDRSLHIKRFTPRIRDLFNIIPGDIGRPFAHLTHRLATDALPDLAAQVLTDLRTIEREVNSSDGRRYLARLLPYRSLEDRIEGVVITLVEVSDLRAALAARRHAEDSLVISEERLRIAIAGAPIAVFTLSEDGDSQWGFMSGRALEDRASILEVFGPGHGDRFVALARDVARSKTSERAELDVVLAGNLRTYDFRFEPAAYGVNAVGFDITPSKLAERSLRDVDRRKDEFLATLSHELRNPLTPLRVALDVARLADNDPTQRQQSLAIMERQVNQLTQLVDELLDLSRITQGKVDLAHDHVDPAAILEAALEATRPLIKQHRHHIRIELPDVSCRVIGDHQRLVQVMINLIANAVKYTPDDGSIAVVLAYEDRRSILIIRVSDNGVGIDPDMLPRIFDIFVQSRDALGRSQNGLGIGLNLVRRLVELHGGHVSASSPGPNLGTEIVLELPAVRR